MNKKFEPWRSEEDNFLRENYSEIGAIGCAAHLARSIGAIRTRCYILGIRQRQIYMLYTPEEDEFLLDFYREMKVDEMADVLDRTPSSIRQRIRTLMRASKS